MNIKSCLIVAMVLLATACANSTAKNQQTEEKQPIPEGAVEMAVNLNWDRAFANGSFFLLIPECQWNLAQSIHLCKSAVYSNTHSDSGFSAFALTRLTNKEQN